MWKLFPFKTLSICRLTNRSKVNFSALYFQTKLLSREAQVYCDCITAIVCHLFDYGWLTKTWAAQNTPPFICLMFFVFAFWHFDIKVKTSKQIKSKCCRHGSVHPCLLNVFLQTNLKCASMKISFLLFTMFQLNLLTWTQLNMINFDAIFNKRHRQCMRTEAALSHWKNWCYF